MLNTLHTLTSIIDPGHLKSEFDLSLPDLNQVEMLGLNGRVLLLCGLAVCFFGLLFGVVTFNQLRRLPVHESMRAVSELIYETCKTYLLTQLKFIGVLWVFIGAVIVSYFGLVHGKGPGEILLILAFSLVGIAGSVLVAAFGIALRNT